MQTTLAALAVHCDRLSGLWPDRRDAIEAAYARAAYLLGQGCPAHEALEMGQTMMEMAAIQATVRILRHDARTYILVQDWQIVRGSGNDILTVLAHVLEALGPGEHKDII